jgi:NADH-quinone oxidoreductase subunit A
MILNSIKFKIDVLCNKLNVNNPFSIYPYVFLFLSFSSFVMILVKKQLIEKLIFELASYLRYLELEAAFHDELFQMLKYFSEFFEFLFYDNFYNEINSLLHNEYAAILIFLLIAIILSFVIVTLSYLLAIQNPETEKLSSYECGFEPYEDARNAFEIKFYLVAILFIIFDVETMFLLPWSVSLAQLSNLGFWSMIDFIIELGVGFIYVWYIGALEWD